MIRYPTESRLRQSVFVRTEGVDHWQFRAAVPIPPNLDDVRVAWDGSRLDQLAQRYYGSPLYRWVIAAANGLTFMDADLYPGITLRIPSERYVREVLAARLLRGRE